MMTRLLTLCDALMAKTSGSLLLRRGISGEASP
jgi:hypothetical protein